jgi:hypothetical protein
MPDQVEWIELYNPTVPAWHRVPNHPAVVQDFRDRGWETPEDIAARAGAEAEELKGKALDEALESAGLSKSGTADEKRERLADHEAASAITTNEEEGLNNG